MSSTAKSHPICAKYPTLYPPECPKCPKCSVYSAFSPSSALSPSESAASNSEEYKVSVDLRTFWEDWDLRILVVYILLTQLYLLIFGRLRRRWIEKFWINLNVWFLYIFADLLAVVALGKLSQVNEGKFNEVEGLLRGLWAPIILFYLGGPDTVTLLCVEEAQLWTRHIISLLTQGARTCYVLIVSWTDSTFSALSLVMLISGIIKYTERIWVSMSRTREISRGFPIPNDGTTCAGSGPASPNRKLEPGKQTELVVAGYTCFQTLKPHIPGYRAPESLQDKFIKEGRTPLDIFKQIEIELGFLYDVLFSKVGTIFTRRGFILRFITLSCVVCVLGFFIGLLNYLDPDHVITIILLLGAIILEIVGLFLQLVSDWAVVWAWKHQSKLSSPILFLHEHLFAKRQRWSDLVGQFSLLDFCTKYEATVHHRMVRTVRGWRKLLSKNFSLPPTKAEPTLKKLIIEQLRKISQEKSGQSSQISSMKVGEWTLPKNGLEQELEWIMNRDFSEAIVLWHLATDICYHSKDEESTDDSDSDSDAAKILSWYMMHLLLIRPYTLPFCNKDGDFWTAHTDIMGILEKQKPTFADACKLLKEKPLERCESITVKHAQDLANALMQKPNKERWEIMSSMWVEMLCYAAKECKMKYHAQELRHGGEFLTQVWLLLMHFGIYGDERIIRPDVRANAEEGITSLNSLCQSMFSEGC